MPKVTLILTVLHVLKYLKMFSCRDSIEMDNTLDNTLVTDQVKLLGMQVFSGLLFLCVCYQMAFIIYVTEGRLRYLINHPLPF